MTDATTDELLALARKATSGEWRIQDCPAGGKLLLRGGDTLATRHPQSHLQIVPVDDAAYIAAAHPAAIIAMHERHRAEIERLTRERDGHKDAAQNAAAVGLRYIKRAEFAEYALAADRERVGELEKINLAAGGIVLQVESLLALGPSHDGTVERDLKHLIQVFYRLRAALACHRDMGPDFTHIETNCPCGGSRT